MVEAMFQGKSLSFWLELLKDHDTNRQREAAAVLACMGLPAIHPLVKMFKDGHHSDRCWAIRVLGRMGPQARIAVPIVLMALRDADEDVRGEAAEALERIDPKAAAQERSRWFRMRRWFKRTFLPAAKRKADAAR